MHGLKAYLSGIIVFFWIRILSFFLIWIQIWIPAFSHSYVVDSFSILKKKKKINMFFTTIFSCFNYTKRRKFSIEMVNFYQWVQPFYPIGKCVDSDPNPYSEYVSGFILLLKTDPIRIRIHNTSCSVIALHLFRLGFKYENLSFQTMF